MTTNIKQVYFFACIEMRKKLVCLFRLFVYCFPTSITCSPTFNRLAQQLKLKLLRYRCFLFIYSCFIFRFLQIHSLYVINEILSAFEHFNLGLSNVISHLDNFDIVYEVDSLENN